MIKILRDLKDPKLWKQWCIPYDGSYRICIINRNSMIVVLMDPLGSERAWVWRLWR